MKKEIIFLLLLCANFVNAQEIHKSMTMKPKANGKYISGKMTGFQNGEKIKLYDPEIMKTLDSAYIKNGTFKLKNPLKKTPEIMFIILNDDLVFSCFIAGENIELTGDKKDFKFGLNVKGSKFQKEKDILSNKTRKYDIERDTLVKYMDDSDTTKTFLALQKIKLKRINEIDTALTEIGVKYIKQNSNTYYGLLYLFDYVDEFSKKKIQNLYNNLDKEHRESVYGKRIKTYLKVGKILEVGDSFFDFEAKGQDGKIHKLSEIKDQYILLDFNETYCEPCLASVSELKKMALGYKDNLQIVSFCTDKPEDIWKKGLNRDQPNWLSLWDGRGTGGATVVKYGSHGFPTFVLIDKNRTIVKIVEGYEKGILEKMIKETIKL